MNLPKGMIGQVATCPYGYSMNGDFAGGYICLRAIGEGAAGEV